MLLPMPLPRAYSRSGLSNGSPDGNMTIMNGTVCECQFTALDPRTDGAGTFRESSMDGRFLKVPAPSSPRNSRKDVRRAGVLDRGYFVCAYNAHYNIQHGRLAE